MNRWTRRKIKSYYWDIVRFGFSATKIYHRINRRPYPKILINSIPKAGTHLVERAICIIPNYYRKYLPTLTNKNISKFGGYNNVFSKLHDCEVLVAHFHYEEELCQLIKNNYIKNIFVIRDPRDVVVSKSYYPLTDYKHEFHKLFLGKSEYKRMELAIIGDKEAGLPSIKEIFDYFHGWLNTADYVIRFEDIVGASGGGSLESQIEIKNNLSRLLNINLRMDYLQNIFSDASPTFRHGQQKTWMSKFDNNLKNIFKDTANEILIKYGYENNSNW